MNFLRLILPLSNKNKAHLSSLEHYLKEDRLKKIERYLKLGNVTVVYATFGVTILSDSSFAQLQTLSEEKEVVTFCEATNKILYDGARSELFHVFAKVASTVIPTHIAPNIVGLDHVKRACALQLFCAERIHILLMGDPGTGKTDIARSTVSLHPISSYGLGSGTSGVGLTISVVGKEPVKGLLPMADNGLCAIDELNLMSEEDRAGLYNAMEKGFVSYTKKDVSIQMDARVRVLATANPNGDTFTGRTVDMIKKQLPFDSALLSRFHLVFIIRKPNLEKFVDITKKIVEGDKKKLKNADIQFIHDYVAYTEDMEVGFSKDFQQKVVEWVTRIKERESQYIIEVTPRIVIGIIRLAQANARMHMRKDVSGEDLKIAMDTMQVALETL